MSLSTIIPPVRVHGETTREPQSILKKMTHSVPRQGAKDYFPT